MSDIVYRNSQVVVSDPGVGKVIVYPRLSDKIKFDLDLKNLRSYIVGRDLIIETYSGGKIVVANYALLFAENNQIEIVDSNGIAYKMDDFISETVASLVSNRNDLIVIDRKLSSSEIKVEGDNYPSSSKAKMDSSFQESLLTGTVNVEEQSTVSDTKVEVYPYDIRVLKYESNAKYDVDVIFSYNGTTFLSGSDDFYNPIKIVNAAATLDALYGTTYVSATSVDLSSPTSRENNITVFNGGGTISGFQSLPNSNYAYFDTMWLPQKLDLGETFGGQSISLSMTSSPVIRRSMAVALEGSNVRLTSVEVSGVPIGVSIKSDSKVSVVGGAGFYTVSSKQQSASLNLNFEYDKDFLQKLYNLTENIFQLTVVVKGYNALTKSLVEAEQVFILDFKPVDGPNDILNAEYNTFTFSTLIDPIEVFLGVGNDYAVGGSPNHIYHMGLGEDIFVSGSGSEKVFLDEGDDSYFVGLGVDVVSGGDDLDTVKFSSSINFSKSQVILDAGFVKISNNKDNTSLEGFEAIELAEEIDRIVVLNTDNLSNGFSVYANGDNKILDLSSSISRVYIDSGIGYLTTSDNKDLNRLNFLIQDPLNAVNNKFEKVVATKFNDIFVASSLNNLTVFKSEGDFEIDYSNVSSNLSMSYDRDNKFLVFDKSGAKDNIQIVKNASNTIIGTEFIDTYNMDDALGSLKISSEGGAAGDTVSYASLRESGIAVEYLDTRSNLKVTRKDGVNTVIDNLFGIDEIIYTDLDDSVFFNSIFNKTVNAGRYINTNFASFSDFSNLYGLNFEISSGNASVMLRDIDGNIDADSDKLELKGFNSFRGTNSSDKYTLAGDISATSFFKIDGGAGSDILSFALDSVVEVSNIDFSTVDNPSTLGYATVSYKNTVNGASGVALIANISRFVLTSAGTNISVQSFDDNSLVDKEVEGSLVGSNFVLGNLATRGNSLLVKEYASTTPQLFSRYVNLKNFNSISFDIDSYVGPVSFVMDPTVSEIENIGGANKFRHLYAKTPTSLYDNSVNNSYLSLPSIYTIQGNVAVIDYNQHVSDNLSSYYFRNFNNFKASSQNDIFNIGLTEFSLKLDGGVGAGNTINYGLNNESLVFDLTLRDDFKVYRGASSDDYLSASRVDSVINVANITGSDGNNYFIVSSSVASGYSITGSSNPISRNIVSYQRDLVAYDSESSTALSTSFTRINGFEFTRFNDNLNVNMVTPAAQFFKGSAGLDQFVPINVTLQFEGPTLIPLEFSINQTSVDTIVKFGTKEVKIDNFEIFRGSRATENKFKVNTAENAIPSSAEKSLYIIGGGFSTNNDEVDYSSVNKDMTLNIGVFVSLEDGSNISTKRSIVDREIDQKYTFYTRVDKYIKNPAGEIEDTYNDFLGTINNVVLGGGKNSVKIQLENLDNRTTEIRYLKSIDLVKNGNISFNVTDYPSSIGVAIDLESKQYGDRSFFDVAIGQFQSSAPSSSKFDFIFKNWSTIDLTKNNDYIKISSTLVNEVNSNILADSSFVSPYLIDGLAGKNIADYGSVDVAAVFGVNFVMEIDFTILDTLANAKVKVEAVDGSNRKTINFLKSFNTVVANKANNIFYPSYKQSYEFIASQAVSPGTLTTLDYSKIVKSDGLSIGFSFEVSNEVNNNIRVVKNLRDDYVDIVKNYSNITKILGSQYNDTFFIKSLFGNKLYVDGGAGVDNLNLSGISSLLTAGVVIDLNNGELLDNAGIVLAKILNFEKVAGTSGTDIFKINESFFSRDGSSVDGGSGGVDELHLQSTAGSKFIVDTNRSQIQYEYSASDVFQGSFLRYTNISKIYLGDGDDRLVVGGAGLTYIDGGAGINSVSFQELTRAITGNITSINLGSAGGSLVTANFNNYTLTNFDDSIIITGRTAIEYNIDAIQTAFSKNTITYDNLSSDITLELLNQSNARKILVNRTSNDGSNPGSKQDNLLGFDLVDFTNFTSFKVIAKVKDIQNYYTIRQATNIDYSELSTVATSPSLGRLIVDFGSVDDKVKVYKYITSDSSEYLLRNLDTFEQSRLETFIGTNKSDIYKLSNFARSNIDIKLLGDKKIIDASNLFSNLPGFSPTGILLEQNALGFLIKENTLITTNKTQYTVSNLDATDVYTLVSNVSGTSSVDTFKFINLNILNNLTLQGLSGADVLDLSNFNMSNASDSIEVDVFNGRAVFNYLNGSTQESKNLYFSQNFAKFIGSNNHRNLFSGLNSTQSYNIQGGVGQNNAVRYDQVVQGVEFNINSGNIILINKSSLGISDNLANINQYIGSAFIDTFSINFTTLYADYVGSQRYLFDGSFGVDILKLNNYTSTSQAIDFDVSVNNAGVINWGLKQSSTGNSFSLDLASIEVIELDYGNTSYSPSSSRDNLLSLDIAKLESSSNVTLLGSARQRNELVVFGKGESTTRLNLDFNNVLSNNAQQLYLVNSLGTITTTVNLAGFNSYLLNSKNATNTSDNSIVSVLVKNADFSKFSSSNSASYNYKIDASTKYDATNSFVNTNSELSLNNVSGVSKIIFSDSSSITNAENIKFYENTGGTTFQQFKVNFLGFSKVNLNMSTTASSPLKIEANLSRTSTLLPQNSKWALSVVGAAIDVVINLNEQTRADINNFVIDGRSFYSENIRLNTNNFTSNSLLTQRYIDFATSDMANSKIAVKLAAGSSSINIKIVSDVAINLPASLSSPERSDNNVLDLSGYNAGNGEILKITRQLNSTDKKSTLVFNNKDVVLENFATYILTNKNDRVEYYINRSPFNTLDGKDGFDTLSLNGILTDSFKNFNLLMHNKDESSVAYGYDTISAWASPAIGDGGWGNVKIFNRLLTSTTNEATNSGVLTKTTSNLNSSYFSSIYQASLDGPQFKNFEILDFSLLGAEKVNKTIVENSVSYIVNNIFNYVSDPLAFTNVFNVGSSFNAVIGYGGLRLSKILLPAHHSGLYFDANFTSTLGVTVASRIPGKLYADNITASVFAQTLSLKNNLVFYNEYTEEENLATGDVNDLGVSPDSIIATNLQVELKSDTIKVNFSGKTKDVVLAKAGMDITGSYVLADNSNISFSAENINNISSGSYSADNISISSKSELETLSFAALYNGGIYTTGLQTGSDVNLTNKLLYSANQISLGKKLGNGFSDVVSFTNLKVPEIAKYTKDSDDFLVKIDNYKFGFTKKNAQYVPIFNADDSTNKTSNFRLSIAGLSNGLNADRVNSYSTIFTVDSGVAKVQLPFGSVFTSVSEIFNLKINNFDATTINAPLIPQPFGGTAGLILPNYLSDINISVNKTNNPNDILMVLLASKYYRGVGYAEITPPIDDTTDPDPQVVFEDLGGYKYSLNSDNFYNTSATYAPAKYLFQDTLGESSMYVGRKDTTNLTGDYNTDFYKASYTNASVIILGIDRPDDDKNAIDPKKNTAVNLVDNNHKFNHYAMVGKIIDINDSGVESRSKIGEFYLSNKVSILTSIKSDGSEQSLWKEHILSTRSNVPASGSTPAQNNKSVNESLGASDIIDYSGIKSGRFIFTPSYQTKTTQVGLPWRGIGDFLTNQATAANFNPLQINYMNTRGMSATAYSVGTELKNDNLSNGFWGMYLNDTKSFKSTSATSAKGSKYLSNNIVFSTADSRSSVELGLNMKDGYSNETPLYYRNVGFEIIKATDSDDTYITGMAHWSDYSATNLLSDVRDNVAGQSGATLTSITGTSTTLGAAAWQINPILHPSFLPDTAKATRLLTFDGSAGYNTVVDNTFTASFRFYSELTYMNANAGGGVPDASQSHINNNTNKLFPFVGMILVSEDNEKGIPVIRSALGNGGGFVAAGAKQYVLVPTAAPSQASGFQLNADIFGTGFLTTMNTGTNALYDQGNFNGTTAYKRINSYKVEDYKVDGDKTTYDKVTFTINWGVNIPDSSTPGFAPGVSGVLNNLYTIGTPGGYTLPPQTATYYTGIKNYLDFTTAGVSGANKLKDIKDINMQFDLGGRFTPFMAKTPDGSGVYPTDDTYVNRGTVSNIPNYLYQEAVVLPDLDRVMNDGGGKKHNIFWLDDEDPRVDTAAIILTGANNEVDSTNVKPDVNGVSFSSSLMFKNFDILVGAPGFRTYNFILSTNLNFDKLAGKMVTINQNQEYIYGYATQASHVSVVYNNNLNFTVTRYVQRGISDATALATGRIDAFYLFKDKFSEKTFILKAHNMVPLAPTILTTTQSNTAANIVSSIVRSANIFDDLNDYYNSTNYFGTIDKNTFKHSTSYNLGFLENSNDSDISATENTVDTTTNFTDNVANSDVNIVNTESVATLLKITSMDITVDNNQDNINELPEILDNSIDSSKDVVEQDQEDLDVDINLDLVSSDINNSINDDLLLSSNDLLLNTDIDIIDNSNDLLLNTDIDIIDNSNDISLDGFNAFAEETSNSDIVNLFNNLDSSDMSNEVIDNADFMNISNDVIVETAKADEMESIAFALDSNVSTTEEVSVVAVDNSKNKNNTNNS